MGGRISLKQPGIYNLGHSLLSEPLKGAIEDFMHLVDNVEMRKDCVKREQNIKHENTSTVFRI